MSKTSAVLLGTAIGDALGMQFETKRYSSPLITDWDGKSYGTNTFHKCKAGEWTDDTAMSKALAESLIEKQEYNAAHTLQKYVEWYKSPGFKGAGANTTEVLFKVSLGATWQEASSKISIGNGTAMRVSPIGVWYRDNLTQLFLAAKEDAILTHNTKEAQEGSACVAYAISTLLKGANKEYIMEMILDIAGASDVRKNIVKAEGFRKTDRVNVVAVQQELGAKYTVVETVARALYVFSVTSSFQEAIEFAIRGGGDTDTAAAIVGALAGAHYGLEGIPQDWITPLDQSQELMELDRRLYNRV